jgi:hypothetical protein
MYILIVCSRDVIHTDQQWFKQALSSQSYPASPPDCITACITSTQHTSIKLAGQHGHRRLILYRVDNDDDAISLYLCTRHLVAPRTIGFASISTTRAWRPRPRLP